jgi:hypothetical protein
MSAADCADILPFAIELSEVLNLVLRSPELDSPVHDSAGRGNHIENGERCNALSTSTLSNNSHRLTGRDLKGNVIYSLDYTVIREEVGLEVLD